MIKNKGKVRKFTIKILYGSKLNEVIIPKIKSINKFSLKDLNIFFSKSLIKAI